MRPSGQSDGSNGFPDILYKYRCWSDREEHTLHKRLLTHGEIYFAKPSSFNDPFDCQIALRLDMASAAEMRRKLMKGSPEAYPGRSYRERERLVTKRILALKNPDTLRKEKERQRRMIDETFGVLSLTAAPKSLVMWAHHAESHTGICVGLHTKSLLAFSDNFIRTTLMPSDLMKVDYVDDYPIIDLLGPSYKPGTGPYIVVKSKSRSDWSYEDEYRLYIGGRPIRKRLYVLPDSAISEVILGCNMSPHYRQEVKTVLRGKATKILLLQAKLKEYSFGLDFDEVTY